MIRGTSFAELVDWLEGQVDAERSEAISRRVSEDRAAREAADQAQTFLADARRMPLADPPSSLRDALQRRFEESRDALRDSERDAHLLHDSAGRPPLPDSDPRRLLAYESDVGRVALEVGPAASGQVSIRGLVVSHPGQQPAAPLGLILMTGTEVRRITQALPDGTFELDAVPDDVDALLLTAPGGVSVRVPLPL